MNVKKIAAVAVIYILTSIAWIILSTTTAIRTDSTYGKLESGSEDRETSGGRADVQHLWGAAQLQHAPTVWTTHKEKQVTKDAKGKNIVQEVSKDDPAVLSKSRINVKIDLDPRRKGLLWYSTYRVKFAGDYAFSNEYPEKRTFFVKFVFPANQAAFDNVLMYVKGQRLQPKGNLAEGIVAPVKLNPKESAEVKVAYGSQGLDTWHYQFTDDSSIASVRDFDASIVANCRDIDFPESCLSPTSKTFKNGGWNLRWKYGDLISGSQLGISMPQKLQPGPFASRLSKFAPVSLFFFFAVLLIIGTLKNIKLHPVNYLFLAATFFSFHLLFSYLVDHFAPFPSFLVASAVSLLLTITYLRLVVDWKFSVFQAGFWQFVFLVLFTYAFFFEGYTGLTITIGAILTLAAMMQLTGRVNWEERLTPKQQLPYQPPQQPGQS